MMACENLTFCTIKICYYSIFHDEIISIKLLKDLFYVIH